MSSSELSVSNYYWERVAEGYHQHLEAGLDPFQDEVNTPLVLAMLDPCQEDVIMDLGCGDGRFTQKIAQAAAFVFGCDQSETLIAYARQNEASDKRLVSFRQDISEPFAVQFHGIFDKVVAKMVFPSLTSNKLCQVAINIKDLLKPGGILVVSTLSPVYHEQYLKPKSETWWYFYWRNSELTEVCYPEEAIEMKKHRDAMFSLRSQHPGAVWVPVSKSNFRVPTYVHTDEELTQMFNQVGFGFIDKQPVIVTSDFADRNPDYQDRIGEEIIINIKLRRPLE